LSVVGLYGRIDQRGLKDGSLSCGGYQRFNYKMINYLMENIAIQ
jgi:hypothetical protein